MDIIVDRVKMIKEVETELKEYEEKYQKSKEIYRKKLAEYSKYVEKLVQSGSFENIKSPPYPPSSRKEDFEGAIEMLNAHVEPTIKMDDSEYKTIKSGLRSIQTSNTTTLNALSALSY